MKTVFEAVDESDVDARFKRVRERGASAEDIELFDASMLYRFIECVRDNKPVDSWIMRDLARVFMEVLNGGDWCDALNLPGHPSNAVRTEREDRDLSIFCDVSNALRDGTTETTTAITNVARLRSVSYETARGAYYSWRKILIQQGFKN